MEASKKPQVDLILSPLASTEVAEPLGEPSTPPPRPGDLCPKCGQERLDYDGLLNLVCPRCGAAAVGCFT